jgi:hypothetical protein
LRLLNQLLEIRAACKKWRADKKIVQTSAWRGARAAPFYLAMLFFGLTVAIPTVPTYSATLPCVAASSSMAK